MGRAVCEMVPRLHLVPTQLSRAARTEPNLRRQEVSYEDDDDSEVDPPINTNRHLVRVADETDCSADHGAADQTTRPGTH